MCFSATASFAGAAVVGGIGVATLTQVRGRRELVLGALPMGFAVHQFLEGVTWMRLGSGTTAMLDDWSVRLWVIYAWSLLPLWLPLGVRLIEPDPRRRRVLDALVVVGVLDLLYMASGALAPEITVSVVDHNLDYVLPYAANPILLAIPYILTTCLAPLLSSFRWVRAFGAANVVALSVATWMQSKDFSSIWCTFAAFLSLLLFLHFREQRGTDAAEAVSGPEPLPA